LNAAVGAKILARATIRRAAREFLVAAKLSLRPITTGAITITRRPGIKGPIAAGTIAIARRPGTERPIATRTVAVFTKTFAARCVGPLLAAAFSWGIGLLVAKFPVGRTSSRTGIVAITARRAVVAIEIRTITARFERALVATATIFTRLERTLFTIVTA
jgi:hypothetical protein